MSADRRPTIDEVVEAALARGGAERSAFLDAACGGDAALRGEVESLLRGQPEAAGFLETPPWTPAAPLAPGFCLGPYEILSLVGEGGMAQVYQARDTRLDRVVAIKVLPPAFAPDPARRARFEREAKAIAALNHPNICPLHDVGREIPTGGQAAPRLGADAPRSGQEGGGRKAEAREPIDFLVMEHLEGQTLATRLEKGKLPLDQALAIGAQIADALSAAHRQDVIHRDLKPANVMLVKAPTGARDAVEAKLLDFGLAKLKGHGEHDVASQLASAQKATLTAEGTIVGTLQYMAPEQVEGKPADARADIWALGAILYERATGKRPFEGASPASLAAAILEHELVPVVSLQPSTTPTLQHAIARCLAKDPDARWDSARDVAAELRWIRETSEPGVTHDRPAHRRRWTALGLVGLGILSALFAWFVRRPPAEPVTTTLTAYSGMEGQPSFSPDGTKVAFTWNGDKEDNDDIYVKQIGSAGSPMRLTSSPAAEAMPAWSPDDRWIAFTRAQGDRQNFAIVLVPPLGGAERVLTEARGLDTSTGPRGLCWTPDGKWLLFSDRGAEGWTFIAAVSVDTGERRQLTRYAMTRRARQFARDTYPSISPDGRTLAFARGVNYVKDLYVMPLAEDLRPAGEPIRVTERHYASLDGTAWLPNGGEIVYSGGSYGDAGLWRVNASRNQVPRRLAIAALNASFPTIAARSPRLAYMWRVANSNLWRLDLRTGERVRLVASSSFNGIPQYSPDGRKIAFQSGRSGNREVWTCDADGLRCLQVTSFGGPTCGTPRWSPDGRRIVMDAYVTGSPQVYVVAADGGAPRRMTTNGYGNGTPSWSPDGRWLYFTSDRTGRSEIWKMPADGGEAAQVTRAGGSSAMSSPDGKYLYYVKEPGLTFLYRMPATGGEEESVVAEALESWASFGVTAKGVYFKTREALKFFDTATRKVTTLAPIAAIGDYGICVSPDDRYVVWGQKDRDTSDLMLVENFR